MKKLALVGLMLLVMVGVAFGSKVVFKEDFSTNPEERWTWSGAWGWESGCMIGKSCWKGSAGRLISINEIEYYNYGGRKYKLSFWYKLIRGSLRVYTASVSFNIYKRTYIWRKYEEVFAAPFTGRTNIYFTPYGYDSNGACVWVDSIIIEECSVGVDPTSIGKIKSLYK